MLADIKCYIKVTIISTVSPMTWTGNAVDCMLISTVTIYNNVKSSNPKWPYLEISSMRKWKGHKDGALPYMAGALKSRRHQSSLWGPRGNTPQARERSCSLTETPASWSCISQLAEEWEGSSVRILKTRVLLRKPRQTKSENLVHRIYPKCKPMNWKHCIFKF